MNRITSIQSPTPADDRASSVSEIRLEQSDVTDEELRRLSLYFEKGRDELQKKVDYLLSQEIRVGSANSTSPISGYVNGDGQSNEQFKRSFTPVNLEMATKLREFTVGSCVHSLSNEWRQGKFCFISSDPNDELTFGLATEKKGPRGLIMSVQAVMLKNLLESSYKENTNGKDLPYSETKNERKILKPSETEKKEVLVKTFAEILWKAGERTKAWLAVDSMRNCFDPKNSGAKKSNYFADGLTERLHFYQFDNLKSLEEFIKKNFSSFQKENGCILFLYSLIMSRTFEKIQVDLQGSSLVGEMEECKMPLFNLVLTGTATPFLHNNTTYYTPQGESREKALVGIKHRNDVGILYWNPKEIYGQRTEVGSMLKTPKFPIWLAIMGRNSVVVLFNTNANLINDWRLERNFTLHFFSGLKSQDTDLKLDIVSRNPLEIRDQRGKLSINGESEQEAEIFSLIKSKWPDSEVANFDGRDLMQLL